MVVLKEPVSAAKIAGLLLVIAGVVVELVDGMAKFADLPGASFVLFAADRA